MIKNYFKIAVRNLWKNKKFPFINIFGLATGLAVFIVAAVIAVFIALMTISTQAVKAAIANPVKSLRTE